MVDQLSDEELFTKQYHGFAGATDPVAYLKAATAVHYRSAQRHIAEWWKNRQGT